jgi:hypothetical protein
MRISSIPLGPPLAAVARHRLLGRFIPRAPARLLNKQPREHLLDIDFDGEDELVATAAAGRRERFHHHIDTVPSAR